MSHRRHNVTIVGAGFSGLQVAQALRKSDAAITIVDRSNHHLFQPLLYQVATGGLSPADISAPIRSLVAKNSNTRVILAEVTDIDAKRRRLVSTSGLIDYDTLVLAPGATHSYFGNDDWSANARGLKSLNDATAIRSQNWVRPVRG